ncbi:hypothetical protein AKJ16_DCAP12470 [Drosera capensis]
MNFRSMDEFWGFYMSQHSKPSTRRWHFVGTLMGIVLLIYGLVFNWWVILLVPLIGYGLAWYSHFFIEGNVPATFGHPIWSFLCDCKMFGLMLTGQMDKEIKRLATLVTSQKTQMNPKGNKNINTYISFIFAILCVSLQRQEEIN